MNSLKEIEQQVKILIASEKWAQAHQICLQILQYDPENSTFLKFKTSIEKAVNQINQKAIREELKKLDPLLHNKQYESYLQQIAPLQNYIKDYPEISKKILLAQQLLEQSYQEKVQQAVEEVQQIFLKNKNHLDFENLRQQLNYLHKQNPHEKSIPQLLDKITKQHIKNELQQQKPLLESNHFEDIIIFLLRLQKLAPNNNTLKNQIEKIKQRYQIEKVENQRDFIFKTLEEAKLLFIRKKYDLCMELCERVLSIDPRNPAAITYLQKSTNKASQASENLIITQLLANYKNFPQSRNYQEKNYIRI